MQQIDLINKWFQKAYNDLITAFHMFMNVHPKQNEISCYHCQQAVEKALKAFLLFTDIEAPYTHDLAMLCQLCIEQDSSFSNYLDDCADLSQYATRARYPDDIEITEEETSIALHKALLIYQFIYGLIPNIDKSLHFDNATV